MLVVCVYVFVCVCVCMYGGLNYLLIVNVVELAGRRDAELLVADEGQLSLLVHVGRDSVRLALLLLGLEPWFHFLAFLDVQVAVVVLAVIILVLFLIGIVIIIAAFVR